MPTVTETNTSKARAQFEGALAECVRKEQTTPSVEAITAGTLLGFDGRAVQKELNGLYRRLRDLKVLNLSDPRALEKEITAADKATARAAADLEEARRKLRPLELALDNAKAAADTARGKLKTWRFMRSQIEQFLSGTSRRVLALLNLKVPD